MINTLEFKPFISVFRLSTKKKSGGKEKYIKLTPTNLLEVFIKTKTMYRITKANIYI